MKKIAAIISAIAALATLAGCSRKTTLTGEESQAFSQSVQENSTPAEISEDIRLQKISELRGDLDRQIENVKNADYDNLHALDNFTVTIPETDVLYELELTQREYTWQEYYDKFYRVFEANFGDIYTEEEMAQICSALAQEDVEDEVYGYGEIATLAERREKFDSGEMTFKWLEFSADKAFLEISASPGGNGIYRMFRDGLKNRANIEGNPEYYRNLSYIHAERLFKTVKEAFDVNSGDRYELLDTEVSLNDAAEKVTRIVKEFGYTWGGDLEPGIYEYRVFDLNDGKYGLEFEFAPFYKGVMLDCGDVIYSASSYGAPDLDKINHDYSLYPAHALMIESGKLESFKYGDGAYSAAELAEYDSVIPLDKAVEIAAEKFGGGMKLSLGSAELRYSEMYNKNEDETIKGAFPVWKLKLANSMDGWKYITYINATTGEMEYYLTEKWML